MIRSGIRKLLVVSLAAGALTSFGGSTFAATAEESAAQAEMSGWCQIVPRACEKICNGGGGDAQTTSRCTPSG